MRRPPDPQLVRPAHATATAILRDLAGRKLEVGSLRGAAAALVLDHALGEPAAVPTRIRHGWEVATIAELESESASLFDGALGAAWALAITGRATHALPAIDNTVLEILATTPWPGGLATLGGGLTGFGVYGLARRRTLSGRRIVARCIAQLRDLAVTGSEGTRWLTASEQLPSEARAVPMWLINMEGCAAIIGFAAAAAEIGITGARSLAIDGARALATDLSGKITNAAVGIVASFAAPGLVYGTGAWALGSAGVACALTSTARMSGAARHVAVAVELGTALAHLDPAVCDPIDASFGSGSIGIACSLTALYELTGSKLFANAAAYWTRRTLREQKPGSGLAGYSYFGSLTDVAEQGSTWTDRPDLLEGAAGTALGLLFATGSARTGWQRCVSL